MDHPNKDSIWRHKDSGDEYKVLVVTNVNCTNPNFQTSVTYVSLATGEPFSRPLVEWVTKFSLVREALPLEVPAVGKAIYFARHGKDDFYLDGPGTGMGYHGGYLFPDLRFTSLAAASSAAACANVAYLEGFCKCRDTMANFLLPRR